MTASLAKAFLVINRFFKYLIDSGIWSTGFLSYFKYFVPPIGSFGQQHIVTVDSHHNDIVYGSAFFDQAVVDDDKPRGGFR
jgi:hypothetical protein